MGMRGVPEGDWWCPACVARADVCGDKSSDEPHTGMHTSRDANLPSEGGIGALPPSPPTAGEWACECAGADEMERRGFTTLADETRSRERALVGSAHCSVRSAHRSAPRIPPFWRPAEACVSLEDLPCMRCGDAGDEGGVRALRAVPERGALRVSGDAGAARGGVDVRRVRGGRGEGNEARGEMSETREVDACMGGRHFFVTSGVAETTQEGSFAPSADRPTWRAPADRARARFVRRFRRATIAISSELYLRHVTRASPLFVRASGH